MKSFSPVEAAQLWNLAEGLTADGQGRISERMRSRAQGLFAESISDSNLIPALLPVVRRTLLAEIAAQPSTVERWTTAETVDQIDRDVVYDVATWTDKNVAAENMGNAYIPGTLPSIVNRERYQQISFQATSKTLRANTVGLAFGVDWQAIVNSRGGKINLLSRGITELGKHASQHKDATPVKQLITPTGINTASLGTTGHVITGNPSAQNVTLLTLRDAIAAAKKFKIDGVPMVIPKFTLLTDAANVPYFNQVLGTRTLVQVPARTGAGSTTTSPMVTETIDLGAEIEVIGNQWLQAINPTLGANAWFLIPQNTDRPNIVRVTLEGYPEPQFFMKDTNSKYVGGGAVPTEEGDFDSDSISSKVRWAFGGSTLWNEGVMYSTGANA